MALANTLVSPPTSPDRRSHPARPAHRHQDPWPSQAVRPQIYPLPLVPSHSSTVRQTLRPRLMQDRRQYDQQNTSFLVLLLRKLPWRGEIMGKPLEGQSRDEKDQPLRQYYYVVSDEISP